MAVDKKISQLTSLAQVDVVTTTDVLPIVDTSLTETKKITVGALVGAGAAAGLTGVDINSGSIDGTAIGASSASTGAFTTLSASGAVTLNPANAAVSLAPTGTGTVTINPATAGTLNNVAIGGSTAAAGTFTSATVSTGNLTFSGTAQRITGDMTNATASSRLAFQTSTTNGNTSIGVMPNGTAITSTVDIYNAPISGNDSRFTLLSTSGEVSLRSSINGTGTYLPMTFYTGGSERMRLDTSGNAAIGAATGAARLLVQGAGTSTTAGGNVVGRFQTNGSGYDASIQLSDNVANSAVFSMVGGAINFISNGSNYMNISSSGNVGIGTASPVSKLSVGGNPPSSGVLAGVSAANSISLALSDNTNNSLYVKHVASGAATFGTDSGGQLAFATNGFTERMRIDSSGNVGIGIASPGYKFDVVKGSVGDVARFTNGVDASLIVGAPTGGITYNQLNGGYQSWQIASSEKMRLDSSGNVGIGNTNLTQFNFRLSNAITGSTSSQAIRADGTVQSGVTSEAVYVNARPSTAAASFTLTDMKGFAVSQGTFGAGSAVTNQYGFIVDSSLTGATNNYGFYSNIASGSNRWNFYANGTAQNYFAGVTLVGTTTEDGIISAERSGSNVITAKQNSAGGWCYKSNAYSNGGTYYHIEFLDQGTSHGSIQSNGTNTSYNTTSDYRLKENIAPADDAGALVDAIQIVKHDWKAGGHTRYGVIAQDLHQVAPEAVAKGNDGDEVERPWGVDYSKLVPILVKEIQSLRARVATLEAK